MELLEPKTQVKTVAFFDLSGSIPEKIASTYREIARQAEKSGYEIRWFGTDGRSDLEPVIQFAEENKYDRVYVFTDGYLAKPAVSNEDAWEWVVFSDGTNIQRQVTGKLPGRVRFVADNFDPADAF